MNKQLLTNNKEFQFLENFSYLEESNIHKGIEQVKHRRLIPLYSSYLDQYFSGNAEMHLHIGWFDKRPIGMANTAEVGRENKGDYCIIFKKLSVGVQGMTIRNGYGEATWNKTEGAVLSATADGNKLTVLICVFKAANISQTYQIDIDKVSKLIRLQSYNDCPSLRVDVLDSGIKAFHPVGIIDHKITTLVFGEDVFKDDWEASVISSLFGDTSDNDIVECTSQVMYEITEHNGNHRIRLLSDTESAPDFILAVRQPDTSELVRIAVCVPSSFLLDVYHVLLCPLVFEPPIFIHDMLYYPYGEENGKETKDSKRTRDTCSN